MPTLIILPTQLFEDVSYIKKHDITKIIIYEDPKFFTAFLYHKLKLLYHRVTCKKYSKYIFTKCHINVEYIDFYNKPNFKKITHIIDPSDHELEKKYKKLCCVGLTIIPTQHFLLQPNEIKNNSHIFYKNNKFNHSNFYKWQRIKLNLLMNKNNTPKGNKWSFDKDNRKKIPKGVILPGAPQILSGDDIELAKKYINKYFSENYGDMNLIYPIDHKQAKYNLTKFIKTKLKYFGQYQDASQKENAFLYHSVLTPSLNIGLITDMDIIRAIKKITTFTSISIASIEGFIRQVIGWRNYIYSIYILAPEIQNLNFFKHKKKLSDKWWTEIGIDPIDDIIQNKIVKYAYTHHIERLMYLGSYMLISEIDPKEVYRYFMEWAIDAYEWVMIGNVYGMSQFSDGGITMKRPYICSSAYILKMSNYKRGKWCSKWDNLYHAFINKHKKFFSHTYGYYIASS